MLIALSATAFKAPTKVPNTLLTEYGRKADGDWVPVGSTQPGPGSGQYTCELSESPCRALFESQPANSAMPATENIIENDGVYTIN
jgi:hypothetical protein